MVVYLDLNDKILKEYSIDKDNPPATYNVNNYACTDFGIAVGKLGGINLPSTKTSTFAFNGTSPGNLGEDIRNGTFPNTTKTTTKNNAPQKKGVCKN